MTKNFQYLLALFVLACLSRPVSNISLSQSSPGPAPPKKRVFKNEELDKYQEKYGSETTSPSKTNAVVPASVEQASSPEQERKPKVKQDLTGWRAKLKELDDTI